MALLRAAGLTLQPPSKLHEGCGITRRLGPGGLPGPHCCLGAHGERVIDWGILYFRKPGGKQQHSKGELAGGMLGDPSPVPRQDPDPNSHLAKPGEPPPP